MVLNSEDLFNFTCLAGVLIVIGLFLKNWVPPIKSQYIALIMLVSGIALGNFMIDSPIAGFMVAGLVFYKDALVEEFKIVKSSFQDINNKN